MDKRIGKLMGIFILLIALTFLFVACLGGNNDSNGGKETAQYSLTISIEGEGTVEPEEGAYEFDEDSMVNLRAFPGEGWKFGKWEGDVADRYSTETTVYMSSDKIVKVVFVKDGFDDTDDTEDEAVYISSVAQGINAEFDAWNCQGLEGKWQAIHWQEVPYTPAVLSAEYSFNMPPRPETGPWESLPIETYTMSDVFYVEDVRTEIIITVENMVKSIIETDGFPTLLDARGTNTTHIIVTPPVGPIQEEENTYDWVTDAPFLIEDGHHPKYCNCD